MSKIKIYTTIKVTGMGGCINFEVAVIRKAFEALGITIEIENEHDDTEAYTEEHIKKVVSLTKEDWGIKLIADHQPWGG